MVDKYAVVGYKVLPGMEGRTHDVRVARVLQDRLEAFIASTGGDGADLQTILDDAEKELAISANNYEANNSAVTTKRLKSVAAHEHKRIVCGHSCSEHEDLTRPSPWQSFPRELLLLIFARLPLHVIVQSVSKAWQKSMSSIEFSRELDAANHSRIALISPIHNILGKFQVRVYNVQAKIWHFYDMQPTLHASCMMGAADGGLMCFVSVELSGSISIVVVNPFTMTLRILPSLRNLRDVQPKMVHLSVDANTGKYKVVVAGRTNEERQELNEEHAELEVEVYDSETDQWTKVGSSERIYGNVFHWHKNKNFNQFVETRLGLYVCAEGKGKLDNVIKPHMETHWQRYSIESLVFMKNRVLVLHKVIRREGIWRSRVYCISEFECNGSACVEVATHKCDPLNECSKLIDKVLLSLHAACNFLMVFANIEGIPAYYRDFGWLYDLSTKTWCELPPLLVEYKFDTNNSDLLCEIKLSAVP